MIPWKQFEVIFHNIPFSPISTIDLSSDLINFEENIINFLISLWIRPLFIIIPLNSKYFHKIGKFGFIFDTRPCEINDLAVSSRHCAKGGRLTLPQEQQAVKFGRVRGDDVLRSSIQCNALQWAQRMSIRPIWCRSLSSLP